MACGLLRSELKEFNISLDENQRCQAVLPGGGGICNALLSEHVQNKKTVTVGEDLDAPDTSSCLARFGKRFFHSLQVFVVSYLVVLCILVVFLSGFNFEVRTHSVSNLMIDSEADALRFWYNTNQIGIDIVEYDDNLDEELRYTYSTDSLSHYGCDGDIDCEDAINDLSAAWNTLLLASSVSAVLCFVSWVLGSPRNFYSCFYKTKLLDNGVREEKKVLLWFLKPVGLTYALVIAYAVVYGIQFIALFRYINRLPSNEKMYALSLHYVNSDPTLCSTSNPCYYSYDSAYGFNREYAFVIVSLIFAALSVVFVALSHQLKLKSLQWGCCDVFCTQKRNSGVPIPSDEVDSPNQIEDDSTVTSAPPEAILVKSLEVEGTKMTEVDLV